MIKELIAETQGYGRFLVQLYRLRRDGSARPQFRHMVTYQIDINGEPKHTNLDAEATMRALVVYIDGITNKLSKAGFTVEKGE